MPRQPLQAFASFTSGDRTYRYSSLATVEKAGFGTMSRLPYGIRVLLESALRNLDGYVVHEDHVRAIAGWGKDHGDVEIPFLPARVVLQDFTGVPCVVDLAAMRAAMQRLGGDPKKINPLVPCDLVIDHSVQVDAFGSPQALQRNLEIEFERNRERYEFLKWGQQSFAHLRVVPPGTGIVHQVNLEYLACVAMRRAAEGGGDIVYPDSCVGTDSHTTMINGLGVVGWGVGGIEAEAVMLGQPLYMLLPDVVGFELQGRLPEGATATDLVLTVTQMLRQHGVVGKFVEFFGPGARAMSLADRATVANMAPEYGATTGFFPVDEESLTYLRQTGRDPAHVDLVRDYYRTQGLLATADAPVPEYRDRLCLDLGTVEPSLAGPKRPQDRVALGAVPADFRAALTKPLAQRGFAVPEAELGRTATVALDGRPKAPEIGHGAVVIAAITSCTNTSNPAVLIAAGLLARNARQRGLRTAPYVKTSLAPGSRVVTDYLAKAGLDQDLEALGFHTVGYGCTTCIGNSGPLPEPVQKAIKDGNLVAAAVLSGNRNFEGRINPDTKANYLASPPLVVAYALAGRIDVDLTREPLGTGSDGAPVYLRDVWPSLQDVARTLQRSMSVEQYRQRYGDELLRGPEPWQRIASRPSDLYAFEAASTYIQEPPFFLDMRREPDPARDIRGARVLVMVGDSVTTDHISPAGSIKKDSPAGRFLIEHGVQPADFNSYGSRRGNDRVMTRGTFANIRLQNQLVPGVEGGVTRHLPSGEQMSIFDAAQRYRDENTPLVVLAGKEYGTGSSRDWAAKGTFLLGVRMVLAESFERIHRSNLVGMGVLPLQYVEGQTRESLGLTGEEAFELELPPELRPKQRLSMRVRPAATAGGPAGAERTFEVVLRIDSRVEVDYYRHGGILNYVLRRML